MTPQLTHLTQLTHSLPHGPPTSAKVRQKGARAHEVWRTFTTPSPPQPENVVYPGPPNAPNAPENPAKTHTSAPHRPPYSLL